jgi:uncharacterized protein (DUF305 family)
MAVLAVALVVASPAAGSAPAPTKRTAKFEVRFMTQMIDHHAMAVEMGEICLDNAVHSELRAMCQEMIAAQSEEIETMQSWLEDWYGVSHEPEMSRRDMRMIERLAALSGARFEIRFMETIIGHHREAIAEAERCLDRAYHAELRNLCRQIIEAQRAEIAQLREWLCTWYGRCQRGDGHEDDDHGDRHKDRA